MASSAAAGQHNAHTGSHTYRSQMSQEIHKVCSSTPRISLTKSDVQPDSQEDWPWIRRQLAWLFSSLQYDLLLGSVVLFNIVVLIIETDYQAEDADSVPTWVNAVDNVLSGLYLFEICIRLYVYRFGFFSCMVNDLDFSIVAIDVIVKTAAVAMGTNAPSVAVLRLFRLLRLGRAMHVLLVFPELATMLRGMLGAMRTIFWGTLMVLALLCLWAILAVQVLHPINREIAYDGCERCPRAFASVWNAMVTFIQHVIAGDSWGQVSIPIMEQDRGTFVIFMGVIATVGLGMLNLIMAVIVDSALQARKDTDHQQALEKQKQHLHAVHDLVSFCQELDADGDGSISLEELQNGFSSNQKFRDAMTMLDIDGTDVETLFKILDHDKSGSVEYEEFAEQLHRMKTADTHTMIVFIRHYVQEIMTCLKQDVIATLKEVHPNACQPPMESKVLQEKASFSELAELLGNRPKYSPSAEAKGRGLQVPKLEVPKPAKDAGSDSFPLLSISEIAWRVEENTKVLAALLREQEQHSERLPASRPLRVQDWPRAIMEDSVGAPWDAPDLAASEASDVGVGLMCQVSSGSTSCSTPASRPARFDQAGAVRADAAAGAARMGDPGSAAQAGSSRRQQAELGLREELGSGAPRLSRV